MSGSDENTAILRAIWSDMKALGARTGAIGRELGERIDGTNARIDALRKEMHAGFERLDGRIDETNARLDETNARLDETNGRLDARLDSLYHVTQEGFVALAGRIDNLLLGQHGSEHAELRERVARLEGRAGIAPAGR